MKQQANLADLLVPYAGRGREALLPVLWDVQTDAGYVSAEAVHAVSHCLHTVYSQACVAPIRARIEAGRLKVIGFYDQVRARYLDEDEWRPLDPTGRALDNINTPEELAAADSTGELEMREE